VEIDFTIAGQPYSLRPHLLFIDKDGKHVVRGLSFGREAWFNIGVDRLRNTLISNRPFAPDVTFGLSQHHNDVARVICAVNVSTP
jgi:hypothetical protein